MNESQVSTSLSPSRFPVAYTPGTPTEIHPLYGVVAEEVGWVPAPGYVLRRDRVMSALSPMPRGSLLEIGCGSGALLHDLMGMGFRCEAIETASSARRVARHINRATPQLTLHSGWVHPWKARFDYVVALEVLEHIEDDVEALRSWSRWLKPNGTLVVSVPAHAKRWGVDDEAVGHFRRYEKQGLIELLDRTGFGVEHVECWGYPLANMIRPLRNFKYRQKLKRRNIDPAGEEQRAEMSAESGVDRSFEARLYPLQKSRVGTAVMSWFLELQKTFAGTELGNGLLVVARKR